MTKNVAVIDPRERPRGLKPHQCVGLILRLYETVQSANGYALSCMGHKREWIVVRLNDLYCYRKGQYLAPDQIVQYAHLSSRTRNRIKGVAV